MLGQILILNINRKQHAVSPMGPSHLNLNSLKSQIQMSDRIRRLASRIGEQFGSYTCMLLWGNRAWISQLHQWALRKIRSRLNWSGRRSVHNRKCINTGVIFVQVVEKLGADEFFLSPISLYYSAGILILHMCPSLCVQNIKKCTFAGRLPSDRKESIKFKTK